jgi:hypothetical protein
MPFSPSAGVAAPGYHAKPCRFNRCCTGFGLLFLLIDRFALEQRETINQ